jgi:hypothetical protein
LSTRTLAALAAVAFLFAAAFLGVVVAQRNKQAAPVAKPVAELQPFEGSFKINAIDDLRVGSRRIILCGAAFTKPRSMRDLVTAAARPGYQGLAVRCKPVGTGTPCDGNVGASFGGAVVVQCFTPDGADLAARLTQDGFLCGQPSQAGATYKNC